MSGTASDDGELVAVFVQVDDAQPVRAEGSSSWIATVDTTPYSDGPHLVTVTATDLAGNVGAASVTVAVGNAPPQPEPPSPPPPGDPQPPAPPPQTPVAPPLLAPGGTLAGYVFKETDRDGVYETDEHPLADVPVFLFDGAGAYVRNARTDASGWYAFGGLAEGDYRVELAPTAWWELRAAWAPDTTATLHPHHSVRLTASTRLDFGWRPIVRSSDPAAPLSSHVGPSGLTVRSYNDAVTAREVHDRLVAGSLVGAEARFVTVRLDLAGAGATSAVASRSNGGPYHNYAATSDVTYLGWLDGDGELFHEYGHAWSLYYAFMVQQDPGLTAYVGARGLLGDARLGSSYAWNVRELIAEDYRQLFGTPSARGSDQLNRELPPAEAVPGLRDFLATTFTRPPPP